MKDYVLIADGEIARIKMRDCPDPEIVMQYAIVKALADISKQLEEIGDWLHSIRSDGIGVG